MLIWISFLVEYGDGSGGSPRPETRSNGGEVASGPAGSSASTAPSGGHTGAIFSIASQRSRGGFAPLASGVALKSYFVRRQNVGSK